MRALLVSLAVAVSSASAMAASEDELRNALEQRFKGDRSGACIAAAVIENGTAARAYFCAGAKSSIDDHTAFEIGSVTKTMTAALLAEIIGRGEIALDDPLAKLLPPGTNVPSFNGTPITVGNIFTHTSGLPSLPWRTTDLSHPYARLTEVDLLDTLAKMQLNHAPGSRREYSNFANPPERCGGTSNPGDNTHASLGHRTPGLSALETTQTLHPLDPAGGVSLA